MKKKTRAKAPASKSANAAKAAVGPQGCKPRPRRRRLREQAGKEPDATPSPAVPNDSKPAICRLRAQLARAQARIDELQASADTDFLLDIPNRRGFERELNRSIAYIKRYHAAVR